MTPAQRVRLQARLWPAACRAQGWPVQDRALRLTVCGVALSYRTGNIAELLELIRTRATGARAIASTNELNSTTDFDRVKAVLLMLTDDLKATREVDQPGEGLARRLRNQIAETQSELTCWPLAEPMGITGVRALTLELIKDKFNRGRKPSVDIMTPDDLTADPIITVRAGLPHESPSQLHQLLITLKRLLASYKRNAPAEHQPDIAPAHEPHLVEVGPDGQPNWEV